VQGQCRLHVMPLIEAETTTALAPFAFLGHGITFDISRKDAEKARGSAGRLETLNRTGAACPTALPAPGVQDLISDQVTYLLGGREIYFCRPTMDVLDKEGAKGQTQQACVAISDYLLLTWRSVDAFTKARTAIMPYLIFASSVVTREVCLRFRWLCAPVRSTMNRNERDRRLNK
jgi:hypothetical protein